MQYLCRFQAFSKTSTYKGYRTCPSKTQNLDLPLPSNVTVQDTTTGTMPKHDGDLLDTMLQPTNNQIVATACPSIAYWEAQELCILSKQLPREQESSGVLTMERDANIAIQASSENIIYIAITANGGFEKLDNTTAAYMTVSF